MPIQKSDLTFEPNQAWKEATREGWRAFIPEFAQDPTTGQKYMSPKGRNIVYRVVEETDEGNQIYVCDTCGGEIKGKRITHSIWDGPFPCSGSGSVQGETVPYCPNCEKEPNSSGTPIRTGAEIFDFL